MDLRATINDDLIELRAAFVAAGFDLRLVGGAVRDLLRGETPKDIDLCTDADPMEQIEVYKAVGFSYHETGLQHGTITVVMNKVPYEITSLRTETDHDGRHATVNYTRDWNEDLGRRDLTINAMALTFDGELIDPFGGKADLEANIVRFVGNPDDRMREDYLRILRWLRFHGRFASGQPLDAETCEAATRNAKGLEGISRERVWMEVSKIIAGPGGGSLIDSMYDLELAGPMGLPMGHVGRLRIAATCTKNPVTLMVALLHDLDKDMNTEWPDMATSWKWSAEERDLAAFLVKQGGMHFEHGTTVDAYKRLVAHDGVSVEWVRELALMRRHEAMAGELVAWSVPVFPVQGRDLASMMAPGPQMGQTLKRLKTEWADTGYTLTKDQLLSLVDAA